jgi:hypothetical protein
MRWPFFLSLLCVSPALAKKTDCAPVWSVVSAARAQADRAQAANYRNFVRESLEQGKSVRLRVSVAAVDGPLADSENFVEAMRDFADLEAKMDGVPIEGMGVAVQYRASVLIDSPAALERYEAFKRSLSANPQVLRERTENRLDGRNYDGSRIRRMTRYDSDPRGTLRESSFTEVMLSNDAAATNLSGSWRWESRPQP